jgi:hypothetical protein
MRARDARLAGDNKGSLERGQQVLQLAPDHPDLLIGVARALAANGGFDDGATRLEDAVRRGSGFDLSTLPDSNRFRTPRACAQYANTHCGTWRPLQHRRYSSS